MDLESEAEKLHQQWLKKSDKYKVADFHNDMYMLFVKQDYDNEYFDVIFYVEGKELYAHGQILAANSPIFKKQLLRNRLKENGPIRIDDYTYVEFFEFLRCIYSDCFRIFYYPYGKYIFPEDIFSIAQLAHVYKADRIIELCKNYEFDCSYLYEGEAEEIFESIELAQKYSVGINNRTLEDFIDDNFFDLLAWNGFIELEKSAIKAFSKCILFIAYPYNDKIFTEELFEAIIKWAKHQDMVNEDTPEEEKNKLILQQIKDILPYFSLQLLVKFAVPSGLITTAEANDYKTIEITFTSGDKSITGTFVDGYNIFEFIKDTKLDKEIKFCKNGRCCVWNETFEIPSTSSKLKKMKGCDWYLLFNMNEKLSIKHQSLINRDNYLIADMKEMNDEFVFKKKEEGKEEYDFCATVSRCNK